MRNFTPLTAAVLMALLGASFSAHAYDADWKRGRLYYRSVCTACHTASPIGAVSPSTKSKADWTAYMLTDKHAKGKESVSKYVGKAYRDSIKDTNKTAAKFADTPDKELIEDIKSFLLKGAKDGDAPASCS
jgi:mono/diheme cytochrome c family protein